MGTKRAFDGELQEFIEHPRHLDHGNKPSSFAETGLHLEPFQLGGVAGDGGRKYFRTGDGLKSENVITDKEFETSATLPLITGISADEHDAGRGTVFSANLFSDIFEYSMRRFRYEDIYSSLLNSSPRKVIPIGPDHQADVPEFDPELAKNYKDSFNKGGIEHFLGVCVHLSNSDCSIEDDKASDIHTECKCLDGGSIRCVQQHVKEARLKLSESYGHEKFVGLGLLEMGEEVACRWSKEEEILFNEVVYLNPASLGQNFWKQLSIAFPSRTKKEVVSYYFNVFILRRRAVQNRSNFLDIDSDDDEWRESYERTFGVVIEDEDFVVGGSFGSHGDDDSSSEDGVDDEYDDNDGEHDVVVGLEDDRCTSFEDQHLEPNSSNKANITSPMTINETKITSAGEPENGQSDSKVLDP